MKGIASILTLGMCICLLNAHSQSLSSNKSLSSPSIAPSKVTNAQLSTFSLGTPVKSAPVNNGAWCVSDEVTNGYINSRMQSDPLYAKKCAAMQQAILQIINNGTYAKKLAVTTIPVVVHVVHNPGNPNTPTENVSDAVIFDMINTLNEDFQRLNPDTVNTRSVFLPDAADAQIAFCLASKDPLGAATTGITRTTTTEDYYDYTTETNKMKSSSTGGADPWDGYKYLNIWVCNISNYAGFGVAGYAYLPSPGMHGSAIDGLVLDFDIGIGFGSRTPTHEIGHYLGLRHTWGNNPPSCGDDDGFADTPNAGTEQYGCNYSLNSCGTVNGDQIENYMSYANCQNMFSNDQAAYMNSVLSGTRSSLLTSDGCDAVGPPTADFSASITTVIVGSSVQFTDLTTGIPDTWAWTFNGGTPGTSAAKNPLVTYGTIGTYDVTLTASNSFGSDVMTKSLYIDVIALPTCGLTGGIFCEDFEGVVSPALPAGWATSTLGTDAGFTTGNDVNANSGGFWPVGAHTQFTMTNDDACNCNKSADYLTLPTLNFTGLSSIRMQFDYVDDRTYGGVGGTVEININGGGWNVLQTLAATGLDPWTFTNFALTGTDNAASVQIRFHYDDGGIFATGLAIDDVLIYEPPPYDAVLTGVNSEYTQIPEKHASPLVLEATVDNQGKNTVTNVQMTVNVVNENLLPLFTGTSNTIGSLAINTTGTLTVPGGYAPIDTGWHRREYIVSILENDGKRSNDTAYSWVYVSDSVYSRDDGVVTSGLGVGAGSFAILGETFELQTSDYLTNIMSFSFGHAVGDTTRLVVWDMGVTFPNAEVAATAEYIFVPADTPSTTFILPILGGPVLLSAGTYFIGIEDYMSTDNVGVGTTDDIYTPGGTFGQINFGAWDSLENLGGFTLALVLRPMFAPCNVVLTVSTTNSTCGACDGTTTVTATAGTGPYNYLWDDPLAQTNATATALCPASYTVLVTDANGCTETSGITVTDGASMTISITTIDEGCGNANGTATVTASGGTGAYTYTWSNAQTTSTAVGLVAGTYNVTVEDNAGCSVETDFFSAANIGNIPPPTANADLDGSVCADAGYLLNGSIGSSATSSTWSSSGTGTFDDATLLTATYTPSPADTTAGSVTLTLTTNDPDGGGPCVAVADAMILTIVSAATVSAGANDAICEGSTYTLAGIRGGVASTSTWITSGTGSFSNASLVNAVYTPSAADITAGTATLTITTNDPAGICGPATDLMVLTINAAATANAGVDATICEGNTYTLSGSLGGSASSSNWGTSGSGGFNNTTLLAAVYTPSAGDITAGTVNLILTTDDPDGAGPCLAGTDLMVLTISTAATANAGANASICEGDTYALSGAIGGSATSSTWTTSGSGLFNNASLLAAVYTPSAGDIVVGSVTLSLTTNDPAGPCIATVDPMVLTIDQAATATAGADATICGGDTYVVSGTRGGGATSSTWTTSGSGSFTNASLLSTIYTPSAGDITAGTVNLIITTDDPAGPCIIATDLLTLTINPAATASAGADATICEGSTYLLAGARGGSASSSTWTTSGTGSFDLATLLAATYTPSAADITAGSVTLTITTDDPAGPCLSAIDNMVLTIDLIPTASAGADVTICEGDNVTLAGVQGGGASSIAWTSSGTGTFNNNALLAAIYTASAADITAGSVTLTITTDNPAGPCNAASDIMVLTINPAATVNAGIDATICDGVVYPLSGAIGGSASSSTWASSGSGAFDNVTLLNATYTPSAGDVVAGSVSLTLTSNDPAGPCTSTADFMVLTLNAKDDPAFAYSSGTFCQTSTDPTPTISGTPGGTFSEVSANIVFISTSTGEIDVSASILGGPYTIQYVTSGTCPDSSTVNITITTSPDATFTFASPYCQGDPNPLPTFGGGASAGIFSATPGGMVFANASTGEIDLGASSAGSYTVENLIVASGGCGADTATFSVTVDLMATAAAGADATICETDAYTLSGSRGGSATSSTWISSGTGTFDDATLVAATYTPSAADILAGNVTLTITTDNPIGPCAAATDNMVLIINLAATTVAGANDTICEGDVKTLSGSIGGSASSVIWSSSGTGNFNNATLLAPTYTPSAADVIIGSVNLTITTDDPAGPCNPATDFIILVINQSPAASAGADAMICEGSSYTLTGTMGGGASSILWTSSGTGTFDDATLTGATYTPSALDIIIGSATLIITTDNPGGPCLATTDNMLLTINSSATVTAGVAATICEGDTYILSGAMGGSASSVTWISSGTGSFDDATLLAATYTHSAADALAGTVTFTITSDDPDGAGPCSAATDNVVLTIDPSATAAAGADASICEGSTYTLSGSFGGGASTITWITSGNGAFDDATLIGATYTPSSTDIIAGSVTLTITTDDPAGSCTAVTDNMVLTISPLPTITSANVTNITCNGDGDGIIDIIAANGTAPFTYSVDTGLTFQSGSSVGSLITGTYTIVVLDSAGCSVTGSTLTIIEPPAIVVLTSTVDANCGGSDGEVSVTATGGTGALNYLWNDPLASTTDTVKNLGAGSYSVVVTDANACTAIGAATVNDIGGATATAIWVKDADCNGSCDGAATVAVSGGTSPFTYSWNDPGTQVGDTATGLCAGDVIVTVTDNNACQSMDTVSIGEPLPLSIVLSPNDALQGTCNGWATVTVTGGTGPYAYLWSGGETTTSVTGLCPAPVSVQVTDGNQCVDSSSVTIGSYTGIDQTLEDLIGFDIFPNPTQGHLSIKYTFSEVIDFEIRVFNKLGALVFSKSLDLEKSGSYSLDLSGQANGIYYVQLITNQGTIARKVSLIR